MTHKKKHISLAKQAEIEDMKILENKNAETDNQLEKRVINKS